MKKLIALSLSLLMIVLPMAVLAETAALEFTYEGTYVPFEDDGFQLYLPNDWSVFEVTDAMSDQGIFYMAGLADASQFMTVSAIEADGVSIEDLANTFAESCEDVQIITLNGVAFVTYQITASNAAGMVALNTNGYAYNFTFVPADNADFGSIASQIMMSFSAIE